MIENEVTIAQTRVINTRIIMPQMVNPYNTLFGGELLYHIDHLAGLSYLRFAKQYGVTASIDNVNFIKPLPGGDALTIETMVTGHGTRSVEVFVKVSGEKLETSEKYLAATGFVIFVNPLDEEGNVRVMPTLVAESKEEKILLAGYKERQALRMLTRQQQETLEKEITN